MSYWFIQMWLRFRQTADWHSFKESLIDWHTKTNNNSSSKSRRLAFLCNIHQFALPAFRLQTQSVWCVSIFVALLNVYHKFHANRCVHTNFQWHSRYVNMRSCECLPTQWTWTISFVFFQLVADRYVNSLCFNEYANVRTVRFSREVLVSIVSRVFLYLVRINTYNFEEFEYFPSEITWNLCEFGVRIWCFFEQEKCWNST